MSAIYVALPEDLKRLVKTYLPLWVRLGIIRPPRLLPQRARRRLAYYNTVRRFPRGVKYVHNQDLVTIFYRCQSHLFKWTLDLEWVVNLGTTQYWMLRMEPQWDWSVDVVGSLLDADPEFFAAVPMPACAELVRKNVRSVHNFKFPSTSQLELEFKVCRPNPLSAPTYQQCVDDLVAYMKGVSRVAERGIKTVLHPPASSRSRC